MAEFEETLNHILGDEDAMGQIMALARSLSGEQKTEENQQQKEAPDLSAMLGSVDPALLRMGSELLRSTQGQNQRTAALAEALKPFVRAERRGKLDRAVQLAGVMRLARVALRTMQEKGEGHV